MVTDNPLQGRNGNHSSSRQFACRLVGREKILLLMHRVD